MLEEKINVGDFVLKKSKPGIMMPFRDHRSFLSCVVLPNFVEYFRQTEKDKTGGDTTAREQTRFLFNAAVSCDATLDYMYFDLLKKSETQKNFRSKIISMNPILEEISNLSNAFKHCERNKKTNGKKKSNDIIPLKIEADFFENGPRIELNMSVDGLKETQDIMGRAWRAWLKHLQKPN